MDSKNSHCYQCKCTFVKGVLQTFGSNHKTRAGTFISIFHQSYMLHIRNKSISYSTNKSHRYFKGLLKKVSWDAEKNKTIFIFQNNVAYCSPWTGKIFFLEHNFNQRGSKTSNLEDFDGSGHLNHMGMHNMTFRL